MVDVTEEDDSSAHAIADLPPAPEGNIADRLLVIKEGETFLVSNDQGDVVPGVEGMGWYHRDTRHLSQLELRLAGARLSLLSATDDRVWTASIDLANPMLWVGDEVAVPQMMLNVRRNRVVKDRLHERMRVRSYHEEPVSLDLSLQVAADFADIFEVRGLVREHRGVARSPLVEGDQVRFTYDGEDGVCRETVVHVAPPPTRTQAQPDGSVVLFFHLDLAAHGSAVVSLTADAVVAGERAPAQTFEAAQHGLRSSYDEWERGCTQIETDNSLFDALIERGCRDLRALLTPTPHGGVLAAGIPWYVTIFGRDSIIAAHQALLLTPEPARATLRTLAAYQGRQLDPWRDEEPGKILHEVRRGELAGAGYVPHTPYYGTVDATPLFLVLYGSYFRWTADRELAEELLPNAEAALYWIEEHGDSDGDGFVDYQRKSPRGLVNQGWKDSFDSVVHTDGKLAPSPIALAEVQGYVHLARLRLADVYDGLGRAADATRQRTLAGDLRTRFNEAFWLEEEGYFALALDGDGAPVRSITTNPAHGLYCGIVDEDKAARMAARLLAPDMFSGWGIRTMSRTEIAYNPMSYHDGSVWPHDNAMVAAGLKRYGFDEATLRIATAMVEGAGSSPDRRLPELFCGFTRRASSRPVSYPVACAPQAWAAGSAFQLLQAMLGISARADEGLLTINKPALPDWLNRVTLRHIRVGQASLSLEFIRQGERTSFTLLDREGDVRVVMEE